MNLALPIGSKLPTVVFLLSFSTLVNAELSSDTASQRLQDANHIATTFQLPTTSINTQNYGFRYAERWNAATPNTLHSGTDINTTNDCGRQVVAIGNGIVRFKGDGGSLWKGIVLIQHRFWNGATQSYVEVASQYAHVAPLDSLAEGDLVNAGQAIGYIADSNIGNCTSFQGVTSYGNYDVTWSPHLHFEIRTVTSFTATKWTAAQTFQAASNCSNILFANATCRVGAVDSVGYTDPEAWVSAHAIVALPTPAAPSGLSVSAIKLQGITLNWIDNSTNETGFKVERKIGVSGVWSRIATVPSNSTSYTSQPVQAGTTYFYRVRATNGVNDSAATKEVSATPANGTALPAPPSVLTVLASNTTSIYLSWKDNSSNETGFKIEQKKNGGSWVNVGTVGLNETNFTAGQLSAATQYMFRVYAVNTIGVSTFSNEVSATTQSLKEPPKTPSGFTATVISKSKVALSWEDNSTNENGFVIERRQGLGAWSLVANLPENTKAFSDNSVSSGRTYSYRLYAYNSVGNSSATSSVTVSTPR